MDLQVIDPFHFSVRPHALFDRQAMLLTSGDFAKGDYNCMTIGWGPVSYTHLTLPTIYSV